jgi:CheY-like chemotaxis protein
MQKLKNVLLVDDDEITNYINADLIETCGIAEKISIVLNGKEALEYIEKAHSGKDPGYVTPDLILLDINMPVMNGFQFLDHYNYLHAENKLSTIVTMLTTSLIKDEVSRALSMENIVKGYIEKPLTKEVVMQVYETHLQSKGLKPKKARRKG